MAALQLASLYLSELYLTCQHVGRVKQIVYIYIWWIHNNFHKIMAFSHTLISELRKVHLTTETSRLQGRPSPVEASPIGKTNPFSKMAITFEPQMGF